MIRVDNKFHLASIVDNIQYLSEVLIVIIQCLYIPQKCISKINDGKHLPCVEMKGSLKLVKFFDVKTACLVHTIKHGGANKQNLNFGRN